MNVKKAAPHRKAIAEAASLSPPNPGSSKNLTKPGRTGGNNNATADHNNNTMSGAASLTAAETNDDYETSKVNKSKKAIYDDDIRAVQDLDRWG